MKTTKIEWTETTWNPTSGCSKISTGCKNCYAERMAKRLQAMGVDKYKDGFELKMHRETLNEPFSWKNPRTVFVNSMSDLFHESLPFDFIKDVFRIMNQNPIHTFQVLTKRADILAKYSDKLTWTKNIWMGVTVENQKYVDRIDFLRNIGASIKFLSIEPLIDRIDKINLKNINWVIVGGESGPGARPIQEEWVMELKEQCLKQNTPFFFKQWGGFNKKKNGRLLEGKTWDEMPIHDPILA
jgi:protein gp37